MELWGWCICFTAEKTAEEQKVQETNLFFKAFKKKHMHHSKAPNGMDSRDLLYFTILLIMFY